LRSDPERSAIDAPSGLQAIAPSLPGFSRFVTLVAIGLADTAKVGITGGSYGGYASAWCATRFSDRFAAAVPFVGISDLVSKLGTTDIPNEEYLVHARLAVGALDEGARAEPVVLGWQSKTPTLILGGLDDPRVHPGQSLEPYRYLKLRSKAPVRLVRYPGEPHGNRRAASRLDFNLRMMQWFEHYLAGPGGAPPPYEAAKSAGAPTASR
jgi:dipeptidyl aminopeptidase/acylaminoacyl peptidase